MGCVAVNKGRRRSMGCVAINEGRRRSMGCVVGAGEPHNG
jgi:hypothetical protein